RIDLRNKRAELQLFGELAGVEVSDRAGLNFARVDLGVVESFFAGLSDQMPDGFSFLFQVALKIGARPAENVNWLAHNVINLANVGRLSSRGGGRPRCRRPNIWDTTARVPPIQPPK